GCEGDSRAAVEWQNLRQPGRAGPGRCGATGNIGATVEREPATNERVSVRWDRRAAAGTRAGGVLPDHRRDPGIQRADKLSTGGIWAIQWRSDQPHNEIGHEPIPRNGV